MGHSAVLFMDPFPYLFCLYFRESLREVLLLFCRKHIVRHDKKHVVLLVDAGSQQLHAGWKVFLQAGSGVFSVIFSRSEPIPDYRDQFTTFGVPVEHYPYVAEETLTILPVLMYVLLNK